MREWTIDIETAEGGAPSEEDLDRFAAALAVDQRALRPACGLHVERGALSAIFQVKAPELGAATAIAHDVLVRAVEPLGLRPGRLSIVLDTINAPAAA